ncbi:MAG: hypothetical protein U0840_06620 [Gemmataceae bacterium]
MKRLLVLVVVAYLAAPAEAQIIKLGSGDNRKHKSKSGNEPPPLGPWYNYWPLEAHFQVPAMPEYPYFSAPQTMPVVPPAPYKAQQPGQGQGGFPGAAPYGGGGGYGGYPGMAPYGAYGGGAGYNPGFTPTPTQPGATGQPGVTQPGATGQPGTVPGAPANPSAPGQPGRPNTFNAPGSYPFYNQGAYPGYGYGYGNGFGYGYGYPNGMFPQQGQNFPQR